MYIAERFGFGLTLDIHFMFGVRNAMNRRVQWDVCTIPVHMNEYRVYSIKAKFMASQVHICV
jgi:hypothetical protein